MPHYRYLPFSFLVAICVSSSAIAAPPSPQSDKDILTEKIEDKLSDHKVEIAKSTAKLKRKLDKGHAEANGDIAEEIEVIIDVMDEAFSDDGLFRDLAAMFSDFAEDIDIETQDGQTVLSFDGAKVGEIQRRKTRNSEESFSISGLGKKVTLDRETIIKDGKSKTRIVIDVEGGNEIDMIVPDLD